VLVTAVHGPDAMGLVLLPAPLVADERGGLEGEHAVADRVVVADHVGDLIEVA
jgi:hypothetical protein